MGNKETSPIPSPNSLSLGDRWILSRLQKLIRRTTTAFQEYEYAAAKSEIESFFWNELADNYLEMAKQRLYDPTDPTHPAACFTLQKLLITVLKLFAPFLPYVTEEIYQGIGEKEAVKWESIHRAHWPVADAALEDDAAETVGQLLVEIATAVRRYKSEHNLSLGTELDRLQLAVVDRSRFHLATLSEGMSDLKSITRARQITLETATENKAEEFTTIGEIHLWINP